MTTTQIKEKEKLEGELRWVIDEIEKTIVDSTNKEMNFFAELEKKEKTQKQAQIDF